ncbi:acyl dehydratase [Nocardia transvalensis]|uniref:Acyl dehydratase n=1 Tax=Nocardia transvalensis TaxID=37333 RepID=A0A7W9UG66_9NOCA|nr:MaoC family dehydratase N-terminal domain-containing protein [Nocardia transvalensis]MBB5911944.1 acyl dehydratase [Nocardia transvalensis]
MHRADTYSVTPELIREFSRTIGEVHYPVLVAPPTFAILPWLHAHRTALRAFGFTRRLPRVLHTGQTLSIGRLITAGDVLTTSIHLDSVRRFPDYDMLTVGTVLTDHAGKVVQTGTSTLLAATDPAVARAAPSYLDGRLRPGPIGPLHHGSALSGAARRNLDPAVDFDEIEVGTPLPPRSMVVRQEDLATYAEMTANLFESGGSRSEAAAQASIGTAPGMLRLAWLAQFVTSWIGDPGAITGYRADFSHFCGPAFRSSEIEFGGRVTAVDRTHRTGVVTVDALCRGRRLFSGATAQVSFPPRPSGPGLIPGPLGSSFWGRCR